MIAVANKKQDPTQALLDALRHPLRRALLHRYVVAEEPTSPKYLAHSMRQPLSSVSYHVRELAKLGALKIAEEEQRRGAVEHFYAVTPLVTESVWALAAMGLRPPLAEGEPYLLTPEEIARIDEHVAERRGDKEFMDRLKRRAEENRPVLDRLRESEEEQSKKTPKDNGKWPQSEIRTHRQMHRLQAFVDKMLAEELAASTIRNTGNPLQAIFRHAVRRELAPLNPTRDLELPAARGRRDRIPPQSKRPA